MGTNADNTADMIRKGRGNNGKHYNLGEQSGMAKLTDEKVLSIRKEYKQGKTSHRKLAVKYNVDSSTIHAVINRETWRHV